MSPARGTGSAATEGGFMSQINVAVIIGSLRRDSFNALAEGITKLAPIDLTFRRSQIAASRKFLQNWIDRYADWVKKHTA
jgi:small-conductance mechanosensitive channel